MQIFAYLYTDPRLESAPDTTLWGWEVDRIFVDAPLPGQERPQLQALMDSVPAADYLLLRRLEDLGDSLGHVGETLAAIEAQGTTVIAIEQPYRTAQVAAPELSQLLGQVGELQRRRRIRQGHAENRLKALPPPGRAPYGYRRGKQGYTLDRTTAPVVRAFFEQFLLYGSLRGAVRHLAKRYGKKISVSTGRRWLEHPVYRGHTCYGDGGVVSDTHRPILEAQEAAQIDRLLRRNRTLPARTAGAPRSLAGLVVCQQCHKNLTVSRVSAPRQRQSYVYMRVTHCPERCSAIPYDTVLEQTIRAICAQLPEAVAQLSAPDNQPKQEIEAAIAKKEAALASLPDLLAAEILDQATMELRRYRLQTELTQLRQELAQLSPVDLRQLTQAVTIPQFWKDLSEPERRFFFREFIKEIQILRDDGDWSVRLAFMF